MSADEVDVFEHDERGLQCPRDFQRLLEQRVVTGRHDELGVAFQRSGKPTHDERLSRSGRSVEQHAFFCRQSQPCERLRALCEAQRVTFDQSQRLLRQHDICTMHRSGLLHAQSSRRDVEVVASRFEAEDFSTPGRTSFGARPQLIDNLRGYPSGNLTRSNGDLQARANTEMAFAHIEQRGESHIVTLPKPQTSRQATDRMHFSNVHVLILRWTDDDSVSSLGEVGHPECEIQIAQTRAVEAAARRGDRRTPRTCPPELVADPAASNAQSPGV